MRRATSECRWEVEELLERIMADRIDFNPGHGRCLAGPWLVPAIFLDQEAAGRFTIVWVLLRAVDNALWRLAINDSPAAGPAKAPRSCGDGST